MADNSSRNGNHHDAVVVNVHDDVAIDVSVPIWQKLLAEVLGTYFMMFAGCGAVVVNLDNEKVVTHPGISIAWGLVVMVLVYTLGHISGAHFNPAVTIAHASIKRFPLKEVPLYIVAQVIGSLLASGTLRLVFNGKENQFIGTIPSGSDLQAVVIEFIITFYLMFVVSGVATDNRAIGELAGLAVGSTVCLNVLFAGPITGASMNPARSLGPAIMYNEYKSIWVYMVSPILGAVSGTWVYHFIRYTNKPLREITHSASFLKGKNGAK
ncbi:putative major intrinsic protein [Lupinus albus]|uniref:Putative major intrinsic protein n=1 Tax=Lupinus albus TaxID=3870 RepID=A0A6A4NUF1_LUPAL|nr:putative major intrinsic protein [Lupinus albus]